MTYDGKQVANFILDFCDKHDRKISNLPLQKVLYFCHAWSLVTLNKPLLRHQFEAWQYGPVLQYVYREFKQFDRRPISSRAYGINPSTATKELVTYHFDPETLNLLSRVVDFYSRLSPSILVELSHANDGPWAKVWKHEEKVMPGMKIDNEEIKLYYSKAPQLFKIQ